MNKQKSGYVAWLLLFLKLQKRKLRVADNVASTTCINFQYRLKSVNLIQDQLYKITVNVSNLNNMNPSQPAGSNKLFFGYENDEGTPWLDYSEGITGTTTGNYTYYVIPKTNRGNIFLGVSNGGGGYFECEIGSVTVERILADFQPMYSSVFNHATDYYAFGSPMPGRNYNSPNYRYGFNGKEKDDEIKGSGNSLDFGARIYDSVSSPES